MRKFVKVTGSAATLSAGGASAAKMKKAKKSAATGSTHAWEGSENAGPTAFVENLNFCPDTRTCQRSENSSSFLQSAAGGSFLEYLPKPCNEVQCGDFGEVDCNENFNTEGCCEWEAEATSAPTTNAAAAMIPYMNSQNGVAR
ncbi:unnamed protein product [Amoebophrya sp. A120]|nr:unnamed protein product [Amoebophrya sp. A120]|eukprot:GSA120T00004481001.1